MKTGRLLTVPEAASELGVSTSTVRRMVSAGQLATLTPAGLLRPRVVRASLEEYLALPVRPDLPAQGEVHVLGWRPST